MEQLPTSSWLANVGALGRDLARGFFHLLYPPLCEVCGQSRDIGPTPLCAICRTTLTTDPHPTCQRCAATVGPFSETKGGCLLCRNETFQFERVLRLGPYDGLLRQAILRMKQLTGESLAETLGDLLAETQAARLQACGADFVIPVPLHWLRRLWRGYNQSESVADRLARSLHLPLRASWLRRIRNTPHQTAQMSPAARRENLRAAFHTPRCPALSGRSVLLVDDVLTTGTTANEAARALRQAGAACVIVAVLGRAG